ncbi:MAG: hypothetical protein ACREJC_16985 [Tepidisphaeraceae bacterium]
MSRAVSGRRVSSARLERLESRVFLSANLGTNLLTNPGAEDGQSSSTGDTVVVPEWTQLTLGSNTVTVVPYGAPGFISDEDPGPTDRGDNFFTGGKFARSEVQQSVDVTNLAVDINAGRIHYDFSAFLGGLANEGDGVEIKLQFFRGPFSLAGSAIVFNPPDRQGVTKLVQQNTSGIIAAGAVVAQINMAFTRAFGTNNDGYADNLSLVLSSSLGSKGQIIGSVRDDKDGDGAIETGEPGAQRRAGVH